MRNYKILLVDDEELALKGLEAGVNWSELGFTGIFKVHNIKNAQEVLNHTVIDMMICDIEMPGGSGLELIDYIQKYYPEIVTIFYTCHSDFEYCQNAIKAGAIDYVVKPIPYEELEDIIKRALKIVDRGKRTKGLEDIWGELTYKKIDSPIEKVKKMICENISVELSRDELASHVFMSPDYLTKLFKKETGESLSEFIINKRIALSKKLLEETGFSVVEISEKTGFSYSSYFIRIFKKKTGVTPQQYRDNIQLKK